MYLIFYTTGKILTFLIFVGIFYLVNNYFNLRFILDRFQNCHQDKG